MKRPFIPHDGTRVVKDENRKLREILAYVLLLQTVDPVSNL